MKSLKFYASLLCCTWTMAVCAQPSATTVKNWQDQKFSMFIHFGGIYSVLGGVWDGKPISRGLSEQIQAHAGIYSDVYANVANRFFAEKWNADSIVLLAKAAGMRSIVITSKHHDGFCMFKTSTTDFNVVDATPFKRDVIAELSAACKRHGIRFGLYFSLIDWHYPQSSPISSHNSDMITPEHHEYNKKQVTELLTNYGPISELWFDMGSQTPQQSQELYHLVHSLQPNCMVSSRLGNDQGDFAVMGDNQYPDYSIGVPWQSPASFFDETWGYRSWQKRGSADAKYKEKLESLIRVISRGGNYLLNIGPKGDGSVVPFEKEVLLKMGKWIDKNAEAIYGTGADPFFTAFKWGSITGRPGKLYLFVTSVPVDGLITLPGLQGKIKGTRVLGESTQIRFKQHSEQAELTLPSGFDNEQQIKVIEVDFADGYKITPAHIVKSTYRNMVLDGNNAYNYYSSSGIDYNTNFQSTIKQLWTIQPPKTGKYLPVVIYSDEEKGHAIDVDINNKTTTLKLDGDRPLTSKSDTANLKWGPAYLSDPYEAGLGGANGETVNIDINKSWTNDTAKHWHKLDNWQNGKRLDLPGIGISTAYYFLQNITSPESDTYILVKFTSGDGITVFLNGKQVFIHNNPEKAPKMTEIVGLHFKKGDNQLLVQVFNNFKKRIPFALDHAIPQNMYSKMLDPVSLEANKLYPVIWKLHNPPTPHQTMNMPNAEVRVEKE